MSLVVATQPFPLSSPECNDSAWPAGCTRPGARTRVVAVRRRIDLATDTLALADLLLGLNRSVALLDRAEGDNRP